MADLKLQIYQISVRDLEKLLEKFPVFASAELSDAAKKQGVYASKETQTAWYFTRNASENGWVIYVGYTGGLISYAASNPDTGLRVGLRVLYNSDSAVVKSLHFAKRKGIVWDPKTQTKKIMAGKAPVVTFGKIEYIWLNQEDCELGVAKTMELVSLKLLAKAVPFSINGRNNYEDAVALREQSKDVALKSCSSEELAMIVPVYMSNADNYMSATPVLTNAQEKSAGSAGAAQSTHTTTGGEGK